jgi:penicillin-binding protein 1A
MLKYAYLTKEEYTQLCAKPLEINYYNLEDEKPAPYFLAAIRPEVEEILSTLRKPDGSEYDVDRDGLIIETTLSSTLQRFANQAVWKQMQRIQRNFNAHWGESSWKKLPDFLQREIEKTPLYKRLKADGASEEEIQKALELEKSMVVFAYTEEGDERKNLSTLDSIKYAQALMSCGLVALDPVRGTVKAWVGGPSFQYLPYDHVLSRRQTASAFKPIVYAAALEKGISPCTYFENELKTYPEFVNWTPENHDRIYGGEYTMRGALKRSINVATVEALMKTGRGNVVRMARKLGFKGEMDDRPAMALGANTASLLELVTAYGAFANGGKSFTPLAVTKITDQMGQVLYERKPSGMRAVMDTANVAMLTDMLRAVINEGTGNSVRAYGLSGDYAGKTGTAQNYSDGWFVGYTPKIVAGVWVGASSPLVHFKDARGAGNATALPIWANFMGSVERSGLSRRYVIPFKPLSESLRDKMNCPDYKPGLMDEINQMFLDDEGAVDDIPVAPEPETPDGTHP